MTIEWPLIGIAVTVFLNLIVLAAAWGDMRRQVNSNRERQDERHEENQQKLESIDEKVGVINGTVARHAEVLLHHGREIDRLRDRQ